MQRPTATDEEFFRQRGFGQTIGFGQSPALVVVDLARAFTNPDMPLGANLDDEIVASNRLIAACRKAGAPIFFTTVSYGDDDLMDSGVWGLKQKGVTSLRSGTPNVELDPRLDRQTRDALLVKKYASSFFGTDLLSRLVVHRVDTVVIVGCTTSGCVRCTAIDAVQNGFRPMVVREAVNDRSRAAHEQSLFDLQAKYCDVVSLDETLNTLNKLISA